MKTSTIYAVYLPDSTTPDYIGSHNSAPPDRSPALKWRYAHLTYIGQGMWVDLPAGALLTKPSKCNASTLWALAVTALSADQLKALRVDIITQVPIAKRWAAEADAIRTHSPPFNKLHPQTSEQRRTKYNAYHRAYRVGYYAANPQKLAAKRKADRERAQQRRAAQRCLKEQLAAASSAPPLGAVSSGSSGSMRHHDDVQSV